MIYKRHIFRENVSFLMEDFIMEFSYNKQNGSLKICMPPELDECSVKDMRSDADLLIDT